MSNVVPVVEICFASGHVAYGREREGISKTKSTTLLDKFRRGNEEEEKQEEGRIVDLNKSRDQRGGRDRTRERNEISLSLSFCISRRLPLILISSSSFFSFMKSAISSLSCLSLLLSSASLPPLPINLFFSLRSSGPRNEQRKSIGWHCGFVPTPAVLRSSTLVSAPVPSEEMKKRRVFVRYSLFLLLLFLGTKYRQVDLRDCDFYLIAIFVYSEFFSFFFLQFLYFEYRRVDYIID